MVLQPLDKHTPYHFPEKEKFKQRLFEIEKERRNLSLRLEEKTQGLEEKLLSLGKRSAKPFAGARLDVNNFEV